MKISSKNLQNCSGLRHLPVQQPKKSTPSTHHKEVLTGKGRVWQSFEAYWLYQINNNKIIFGNYF